MYQRARLGLKGHRGLGDTAIVLANGSRVSGPSPVSRSNLRRALPSVWMDRAQTAAGAASTAPSALPAAASPSPAAPLANRVGRRPQWGPDANQQDWQQNNWSNGGQNQNGGLNLAQLQSIAQTNPSSLTAQQWAQLQQAGTIPSTLPYSSASLLPTTAPIGTVDTSTAVLSTTGLPSISDTLNTTYGPLPLWGWLAAGGALYLFMGRHRGR